MSVHVRMLESQDPNDWHEDETDERLRKDLTAGSSPALMRQLYPLRARLLVKCPFSTHPIGHVFAYARTTWVPANYPIQILSLRDSGLHQYCYKTEEIELLPAED